MLNAAPHDANQTVVCDAGFCPHPNTTHHYHCNDGQWFKTDNTSLDAVCVGMSYPRRSSQSLSLTFFFRCHPRG